MKHGLFLPPFGEFASARRVADLAVIAEGAGWDGFFVWDHMYAEPGMAVAEAWTTLAAVATVTSRMRLGALVTPLSRRRPWVLARQIATLDQLSGGRLVAGIGLGDDGWREFSSLGEETSPRVRGELLDESLVILQKLLSGNGVVYNGRHFQLDAGPMVPTALQVPVPIWAAVRWPNRRPLVRAASLQGCFPIFGTSNRPTAPPVAELTALRTELAGLGAPRSLDIVVRCSLHRVDTAARAGVVTELGDAGVTWMLEGFGIRQDAADVTAYVAAGPPADRGGAPQEAGD